MSWREIGELDSSPEVELPAPWILGLTTEKWTWGKIGHGHESREYPPPRKGTRVPTNKFKEVDQILDVRRHWKGIKYLVRSTRNEYAEWVEWFNIWRMDQSREKVKAYFDQMKQDRLDEYRKIERAWAPTLRFANQKRD